MKDNNEIFNYEENYYFSSILVSLFDLGLIEITK